MACDITLWAQITNTTNDQAVPMPGVGHDYIGALNEIVNPANGSLSLRLPLPVPPSRGISMPSQIAYNSSGIIQVGGGAGNIYALSNQDAGFLEQGGWNYGIPALTAVQGSIKGNGEFGLSCPLYTGFVFDDPQGSRYAMGLALPNNVQCNGAQAYGVTSSYQATDADGFYHAYTTDGGTTSSNEIGTLPFTVYDNSGTTYHFASKGLTPGCSAAVYCNVPDYIEDRNGNIVRFTQGLPLNETDSAGRSVLSIPTFTSTTGDQIAISGISSPYVVTWKSIAYNFAMSGTSQGFSLAGLGCGAFTTVRTTGFMNVVQSIELPNGTSYRFDYDPVYGMLSKITYPTGAYVQYSWGTTPQWSDSILYPDDQNESDACQARYAAPAILHRYVSYDGSTVAQQQDFQYQTTWNGTNVRWEGKQTIVTTTDELRLSGPKSFTTVYTYLPREIAPAPDTDVHAAFFVPLENVITYNDYSGSTMRTVTKTWKNPHLLASEQVTENGLAAKTTYTYSGTNIIEKDEYDYGQANPTRTTLNQYESFAGRSAFSFPSPIYDRPCQTVIHSGNSAGAALAETDYFYDNGSTGTVCGTPGSPSLTPVSGLPSGTHDEATYSASSTTSRANVTAVVKKCLEGCTTDSTTTYIYDETGQALTMTDPCGNLNCSDVTAAGHTTQYSYSDKWSSGSSSSNTNAYVTKVTDKANHVIQYAYDYATGNLGSLTDANKQPTTYAHNDSLLRLTDVYEPPSPQNGNAQPHTHYAYTDGALSTTTVTNPLNGTTVTTTDGMGHVTAQETLIGSVTLSQVDTTYNGMGNAQSVSNPHTSATQSTDGRTQYCYDALGRKTLQVQPDNTANVDCTDTSTTTYSSAQQWTYSGNVVTFTDESGNQWQRTTDALGRLTKVLEPSGTGKAPSMETDYAYDALDNLLSVIQCGAACPASGTPPPAARARTFRYDGLSRLTSATNPETGTIGYSYDANGNVQTKTDARSVVTTYSYDALNRPTGKSYSNDPTGTPAVTYGYDTAKSGWSFPNQSSPVWSGVSQTNLIGRLSYESNGNSTIVYGYDPVGRINLKSACTPRTCASGDHYDMHAAYDLAGNQTFVDHGLDALRNSSTPNAGFYYGGLTYTYNAAGQMTGATADVSNANHPETILNETVYSPLGGATQFRVLNSVFGVFHNYSPRGWVTSDTGNDGSAARTLTYTYDGTGNLTHTQDTLDGGFTYGYDTLNRLTSSSVNGNTLDYAYDNWGNLIARTVAGGQGTPLANSATTKNQLASNSSYDLAGNMLSDSLHAYSYDAEGHITSVDNAGGNGTKYVYGPEGERVAAQSGTGATNAEYLYDFNGKLATTVDGSGNLVLATIYGLGQHLADYKGSTLTGITYYDFYDRAGALLFRMLPDKSQLTFCLGAPFGEDLDCSPAAADYTQNHFSDKKRDPESGNDYFGARYYSSVLGRFMSPDFQDMSDDDTPEAIPNGDVSNPQTLNLYSYTQNNPLSRRDYDGHASWQACDDGSGGQCWTGAYNGEQNNGLFWNGQSHQWQGSDPNPPPDSDPAGMFFTGLTRAMLGQSHGYQQMGRALMLDGPTLGMKSLAALIPFGRPAFVPANWVEKPLRNGDGVKLQDPSNPHNQVLLEKAKPGSSNPGQQKDYMRVFKNGQPLDANGQQVDNQSLESHIPQGTELPPDTFGPIP